MSNPVHSTGRGGAGNIGHDANNYVDGAIVREGAVGESGVPEYSAGRGGAGNMVQPTGSQSNKPSEEVIPESATRIGGSDQDNFHTGRGGQGNIHKEKYGGHSSAKEQDAAIAKNSPKNSPHVGAQKESILEKVKHAVGLDKKEQSPEPTTL